MPGQSEYATTRIWRTTLDKLRRIVRLRKVERSPGEPCPTVVRELDRLADGELHRLRDEGVDIVALEEVIAKALSGEDDD